MQNFLHVLCLHANVNDKTLFHMLAIKGMFLFFPVEKKLKTQLNAQNSTVSLHVLVPVVLAFPATRWQQMCHE